jgi:MYXO-CTERM domain-containing protein
VTRHRAVAGAARVVVALAVAMGAASRAAAFCPCYDVNTTPNTHNCGVAAAPGANPSTAAWQPIFTLVSGGPAAWGTSGPAVGPIGQGCGKPEPLHDVAPVFPCELLRAIAMQETGWRQFCVPDQPADQVGPPERTIVAFDCGYGVGQVTSGMHTGETPAFDRARVAADPTYNLATGTLILAQKWRATNCVGDNQPKIIEDWYVATWAYNGLAYVNNPNNANYDAMRPVCDPNAGCPARPYQERIWGWMEHPPSAAHWTSLAPAYPNRGDVGTTGVPPDLPEPSCAGPTDCVNTRAVHTSACIGATAADAGTPADASAGDAGGRGSGDDGGGAITPGAAGGCACQVGTAARVPALLLALAILLIIRIRRNG